MRSKNTEKLNNTLFSGIGHELILADPSGGNEAYQLFFFLQGEYASLIPKFSAAYLW